MHKFAVSKKNSKIFGFITFFVFSLAWITCTSHISLISHISGTQKVTHNDHQEESPNVHTETCIDHTQVFARSQSTDHNSDFDLNNVPIILTSQAPSIFKVSEESVPLSTLESDTSQRLFLENKVLRL